VRTYNDVYLAVRKELKTAGIDAFSLEARLLCACASGKDQEHFVRDLRLYASDDYAQKVSDLVRRRLGGEPVAYITGEWEFYGLPMTVSPDVLIPRTDTELLAEKAIEKLRYSMGSKRVIDLCTGSGCVGIAVAANIPDSRVILIDNSPAALEICRVNILRNSVNSIVTCVEADALKAPPVLFGYYDMILCNPPYIPSMDIIGLDTSVRDFEPRAALDGGDDGLDFYRSVSSKWKTVLKPGGVLMFEVGAGQAKDAANIMRSCGFTNIKTYKDTLNIDRVVSGTIKQEER
jgi:release factor glutamine methyltransferase